MRRSTAAVTTLGYAWVPYAVAALLLIGLSVVWAVRFRGRTTQSTWSWLAFRGAGLAVIAAAIALLADAATEGDGLTAIDRPTWSWFVGHRGGPLTALFKVITQTGSTLAMGSLAGVVVVVLLWRRRRADAVFLAVVAIGAGLFVSAAKPLIGRARPPMAERLVVEANQSFPSGHALASIAIIGALAVLLRPILRATRLRVAAAVVGAVFVAAIGVSRLYLGVHWPTDVLGGWLCGAGWLLLCTTARQLRARRWPPPAAGVPS
ncbi:phosphatase PAP2 family protein [Nakamurella panacisegetis]|nr:phosphatase PAP2 family protein [Nakamurella panacisegetis]